MSRDDRLTPVSEVPSERDHIELTFEGEFGNQSPVRGVVTDVDTTPEMLGTDLYVVVDETSGGERDLVYAEGIHEGEYWANVSVVNRNIVLGSNASFELW